MTDNDLAGTEQRGDTTPQTHGNQQRGHIHHGMTWWNNATRETRAYWLERAQSARPLDAWSAYQDYCYQLGTTNILWSA